MRALSTHQPYAELIRLGVKTWETGRSWPMPASVIGERIAICSTAKRPTYEQWRAVFLAMADAHPGPKFKGVPDEWWDARLWRCRKGHASRFYIKSEERGDLCPASGPCRAPVRLTFPDDQDDALGVVRCTAVIAECLPVHTIDMDDDEDIGPSVPWVERYDDRLVLWSGSLVDGRCLGDIDDQLPYGIWTPGTYATRLVDVVPTGPIPVKGRQRLWHLPVDVAEAVA